MNITSIFRSIDGEVNGAGGSGQFTTFVRTWGCNCLCSYCDTPQCRDPEFRKEMSTNQIIRKVQEIMGTPKVTIHRGGTPDSDG